LANGAMEKTNLAAAILQCASSGLVQEQLEEGEHLTIEGAINLADWLHCESSMKAWRSIRLAPADAELPAKARSFSRSQPS
jgi:hypothetical protein